LKVKVSAVIPAYNEEATIGNVIGILNNIPTISEVIVVSDGSTDNTPAIAKNMRAKVIEYSENRGKGAAIKAAIEVCEGDVILFLDADLIGLKEEHVYKLLMPVIYDKADMTVGVFTNGRFSTNFSHKVSPKLSGQRAVKKFVLDTMKDADLAGYGIEVLLNNHAKEMKIRVEKIELYGMTHVMKEEKFGVFRGFFHRMKMYWQILKGLRLAKR